MDKILLRFRDLTQGVDTIAAHNEIAKEKQRVLWGWWKKEAEPLPDPTLAELAQRIDTCKEINLYIFNSDSQKFFKAPLYKIYYNLGGPVIPPPQVEAECPDYYKDKELPAWFEIGPIEPIQERELSEYVLSKLNRVTSYYNSIPQEDIGQFINDISLVKHPVSLWFLCHKEEFESLGEYSVSNITSGSYPLKGKYILHLSDVHFGEQHAYKNPLAPNSFIGKETLADELIEDIRNWKRELLENIGLVLITGDLTWKASPHEFSNAEAFIGQLSQGLGLSKHHIVIVPGNHDIEWINASGTIDPNAELNYRNFYRNIYNVTPLESLLKIVRFNFPGEDDFNLCVIGLNSCRLESQENAGYGYIGRAQLKLIEEYFTKNSSIDYVIALVHHHLLPVNFIEDYDPQLKKVSMLLDAESTMQTLIFCGVKTILHGHQHQPYYSVIERVVPGYIKNGEKICLWGKINVIGAGSLGVKQSHINTIGRNSYNVLTVNPVDKTLEIETRIKSDSGVGFYSMGKIVL